MWLNDFVWTKRCKEEIFACIKRNQITYNEQNYKIFTPRSIDETSSKCML